LWRLSERLSMQSVRYLAAAVEVFTAEAPGRSIPPDLAARILAADIALFERLVDDGRIRHHRNRTSMAWMSPS
jgi:hypothetical protein